MSSEPPSQPWTDQIAQWHNEILALNHLSGSALYSKLTELAATNPALLIAYAMSHKISREDRLKLDILSQMDFTIWACDKELNIKLWEGSCPKVYQVSKEDALNKNYLQLFVDPLEQAQSKEDTLEIIETGTPQPFRYCDDVDGRGFPIQVITQCCRVYDDDGSPLQAEMAINMNYKKLIHDSEEFLKQQLREKEEIEEARSEMLSLVDSCRKRLLETADSRSNYFLSIGVTSDGTGRGNTYPLARKAAERIIEIRRDFNAFFQETKAKIKTESCFCDILNYEVASENLEAEYSFRSTPQNQGHEHSFNCLFRHNKKITVQWREYIELQEVDFQSKMAGVDLMMFSEGNE